MNTTYTFPTYIQNLFQRIFLQSLVDDQAQEQARLDEIQRKEKENLIASQQEQKNQERARLEKEAALAAEEKQRAEQEAEQERQREERARDEASRL